MPRHCSVQGERTLPLLHLLVQAQWSLERLLLLQRLLLRLLLVRVPCERRVQAMVLALQAALRGKPGQCLLLLLTLQALLWASLHGR